MKRSRRLAHSWDWHQHMMDRGPSGFIRERGADTWDKLSAMCKDMVAGWERLPPPMRDAYAYRNPEDRRLG